jgi:hypothetical protein
MQVIQHIELGSAAANITFSSIPQTYTDLYLLICARINENAAIGEAVYITLNGSTSNFTNRYLQGDGSGASSSTLTRYLATQTSNQATANTFGNAAVYIPNYTSSNFKSISTDSVSENNATTAYQALQANLWSDTSAITSITLVAGTGDQFMTNSSATLYGILKGSSGGVTVS